MALLLEARLRWLERNNSIRAGSADTAAGSTTSPFGVCLSLPPAAPAGRNSFVHTLG